MDGKKEEIAMKQYDLFGNPLQPTARPQQVKESRGNYSVVPRGSEQIQRLYSLLSDGCKYSVVDIMQRLYIGDPRSVIRKLRDSGVIVLDEWRSARSGNRYKVYWIKKG